MENEEKVDNGNSRFLEVRFRVQIVNINRKCADNNNNNNNNLLRMFQIRLGEMQSWRECLIACDRAGDKVAFVCW